VNNKNRLGLIIVAVVLALMITGVIVGLVAPGFGPQ
jgi:hypothetical protein